MRFLLIIFSTCILTSAKSQGNNKRAFQDCIPELQICWDESIPHCGCPDFKNLTRFHLLYGKRTKFYRPVIRVPDSVGRILSYDLIISTGEKNDTFHIANRNLSQDYPSIRKMIRAGVIAWVINIELEYCGNRSFYKMSEDEDVATYFK